MKKNNMQGDNTTLAVICQRGFTGKEDYVSKVLKEANGIIRVDNINQGLLTKLTEKMQQRDSGHCVCRQFVYGKTYTMLLVDVRSEMDSPKVVVTVALWPDERDASYYVTREIPFYVKTENIHVWEDFCEAVSGSKAIWENDLLGNFFAGHIVRNKVYFDSKPTYFENIVVDKFIDRLDLARAEKVLNDKKAKRSTATKKHTSVVADLLAADEEE